jgi:hypothetical protein
MAAHLFELKKRAFVLWRVKESEPPPRLVIGRFQPGNPPELTERREFRFEHHPQMPDLWTVAAEGCGLVEGRVYHYFFELTDSNPFRNGRRILCTDPTAFTVDWRLLAPRLPPPYTGDDCDPAAVVAFRGGELVPYDPDGRALLPAQPIAANRAASNNRLVIYELPTAWTRNRQGGDPKVGAGSFRDVLALVTRDAPAANFDGVAALAVGRSHLQELGVNALELLPIADSFVDREWGYATSNYFAPDFDLGLPVGNVSPTANRDLQQLVDACHEQGIRFFLDVVMAFGTHAPLENVNHDEFHASAQLTPHDPEVQQSGGQDVRTDFGGALFRYGPELPSYDPVAGDTRTISPALHHACGVTAIHEGFRCRRHPHGQRKQHRQLGLRAAVQGPRAGLLEEARRIGRDVPGRRRGALRAARADCAEPARRTLERAREAPSAQRNPRAEPRVGAELRVDGAQAGRLSAARLPRLRAGRELRRQPRRRGLSQRASVRFPAEQRRGVR